MPSTGAPGACIEPGVEVTMGASVRVSLVVVLEKLELGPGMSPRG
jgi:hypothetical protein